MMRGGGEKPLFPELYLRWKVWVFSFFYEREKKAEKNLSWGWEKKRANPSPNFGLPFFWGGEKKTFKCRVYKNLFSRKKVRGHSK